jgi:dCMP deaminase
MTQHTLTKWDLRFLDIAKQIAAWSKDPRTKVGCVIVDNDHNQLSGGFNGFPRGVLDDDRLEDHDTKLRISVHAEANAVATAARNGHSLKQSTAYITMQPCPQCAALLIQSGVTRVVAQANTAWSERNAELVHVARQLLYEARIKFEEVAGQ